ncbi:MAG: hypothetical protein M1816_001385 [Peltula sp. TS41687]|nr:MAG: hypothetical protein M1816_001385 [Peltula sp. TS41687]
MTADDYLKALDQYAENQVIERMLLIEKELEEIPDGRFDAAVPVSNDNKDKASIRNLTDETLRCFTDEKVRMIYIAAQVNRIDIKVEVAIAEIMRIYRHSIGTAASFSMVPTGPSTNRITVAAVVCQKIVSCFVVPTVSFETVLEIVKAVIWDDVGHNVQISLRRKA